MTKFNSNTEERCRLALEAIGDGIWELDVRNGSVYLSPGWLRMLGLDSEAGADPGGGIIPESLFQDRIHPEDRDLALKVYRECIDGRSEGLRLEYRVRAGTERWLWILCRGSGACRDQEGRAQRLIGTISEIGERKERECLSTRLLAEKDLILRDVHHRVKNNLSTLRSLLSLQAQSMRSKVAAAALQVAAGRVQSMAMLYDRLYLTGDYDKLSTLDFVPDLVDQILANFPGYEQIVVIKEIEPIQLPQKTVTGLSLIINELLTNSMKYAFKNRGMGLIRVRISHSDRLGELEIQDDGPGMRIQQGGEEPGEVEGFGLMLVRTLVEQLQGSLVLEAEAGTRIKVVIPLDGQAA